MNDFRYSINRYLKFSWQFGVALILVFGVSRFFIVLEANKTGNYNFTSIIFLVMWLTPFILLNKQGKKLIGIKKPGNYTWLFYSFLMGMVACTIVYLIGQSLYGSSISNWFEYISNSYTVPIEELQGRTKITYFLILAVVGMTFSPIGEELLYRGLIHQSFVHRFGETTASNIDSLAFAIVHLAHFGIIYIVGNWEILYIPALLWMILMFLVSKLFFICKSKSDSIYGAILCHSGFNFAMTYFIFYHIL